MNLLTERIDGGSSRGCEEQHCKSWDRRIRVGKKTPKKDVGDKVGDEEQMGRLLESKGKDLASKNFKMAVRAH